MTETPTAATTPPTPTPSAGEDERLVMPAVAPGTEVAFLDPGAPWTEAVGAIDPTGTAPRVEAAAAARIALRYDETKAKLIHDAEYEAIISPLPTSAEHDPLPVDYDDRDFLSEAPQGARYALTEGRSTPRATASSWSGT